MPGAWVYVNARATVSTTNYNDYTSTTPGTTLTTCVDIDGTSVNNEFTMSGTYDGGTNAGIAAAYDIFSANARDNAFYIAGVGDTQDWDFEVLDNAKTYEIRVLASRTGTDPGNRSAEYTIDGTTLTLNASGTDSEQLGTWTGVSPTSGTINLQIEVPTGQQYGYFNVAAIREEDAGGSPYTIAADTAAYTHTGTAAALTAAFNLSADTAGYTYTGTAAALNVGYVIAADTAAYTYTGTAAALTFASSGSYTLGADTASYTYSGTSADVVAALIMAADTAAYSYSGTAAALNVGFNLAADTASYTYTGTNVAFSYNRIIAADSGTYAYSGTAATLTASGQTWVVQSESTDAWSTQATSTDAWTIQ